MRFKYVKAEVDELFLELKKSITFCSGSTSVSFKDFFIFASGKCLEDAENIHYTILQYLRMMVRFS